MKRLLETVVVAALLLAASTARATPSTVVWTPATTYTQPFLVPHVTYDTYFGERTDLATDVGLTIGFVPDNKWVEGELGVDGFYPMITTQSGSHAGERESKNAFQFNGKLSLKEGSVHALAPGLSVGAMSLGLTKNTTDTNVLYAAVGKTFGAYGTVAAGYYTGNDKLLVDTKQDGTTTKDESGFMASYASPKFAVGAVGLKDVSFALDYQSGNNALGAFGAAAVLYFTDAVSLLTGPVIFNNKYSATGGATSLLWTVQLDVDLDFAKPKAAPRT